MLHFCAAKTLEELQVEAILFAENLRSRREPYDLYNFKKGTEDVQSFSNKVKGCEKAIGRTRMVRILRHKTPAVRGLDKNKSAEVNLEDHISWVEAVQQNIEYELEVIDRKRTLALTVASVVAASAAAIASLITLFKM